MNVHIRWLIRCDRPEVLSIADGKFSEEELRALLASRSKIGMVAESRQSGNPICGFMVYELRKNSLEVLQFGVHRQLLRQRIGSQLISKLVSKLSTHRRSRIGFDVPENDLPMQLFLKANGFEATEVKRGEFGNCDGYRFVFRIPVLEQKESVK